MAPKTKAPLSVLDPIKSVVNANDVHNIIVLPNPRSIDAIIDVIFLFKIRSYLQNKKQVTIIKIAPIE